MTTDLLRLATAGSVDDGKSTLVGRLLYDTKSVLADQLAHIERVSTDRGLERVDLSLLTDGLRAEREQGITIDVAYRYFATADRKFVLADTPGHVQYTRNMVTGASTAELAVILVDARKGVLEQTRLHAAVSALLGVRHLVVAVNKMDLVDFDEVVFRTIAAELAEHVAVLGVTDVTAIPLSALEGDNVVDRSERTPWYEGPTLLEHLEAVPVSADPATQPARFPVQYVVRTHTPDYRGYAGQLAAGVLSVGDEVVVLPRGQRTTVTGIDTYDGPLSQAVAGQSVTVRLADDVDVSRGDMIARVKNAPKPSQDIDAMVCWMTNEPLRPRQKLAIKHTTRMGRALVKDIQYRLDVNTLHRDQDTKELGLNEVGRVQLRSAVPLLCDAYSKNRSTGSF
ncbi:MAG: sulfate adenylyltransferase subunit 1, partial [Motilibacteraceae bacterium]